MSIALSAPPPALSFSGDRIVAEFTCTDIFSQVGVKAINKITIPDPLPVGYNFVLKWGGKTVTMIAAAVPDDSGSQFFSSSLSYPVAFQVSYFQANYKLSQDFIITVEGSQIVFTAKVQGTSYNMTTYNTTAGAIETLKSNYGIQARLFCENALNTGYELINESFVNVQTGAVNKAEYPIGDKLHTYISDEIRKNLPDIPTGSLLCTKSCRRYYFEYAEAFNDQYQKVYRSEVKTVLHGGFSALAQATKDISTELFPTSSIATFLKQGLKIVDTRADQPQYLYFYNTKVEVTSTLVVKYYFTDGTVATKSLYTLIIAEHRKYAFNLQFDQVFIPGEYPTKSVKQYEVWLQNAASVKYTESRFYVLDTVHRPYKKYFLNWSSWGSMDTRMFFGKGSVELNLVQSKADKGYYKPSDITKGSSVIFNTSATSNFTATTGFIKERTTLLFNRDFYLSALKYRFYSGKLLPIEVTSKTIPELPDGQNLYAQKFEYNYLLDDHAYTEGDILPVVAPEAPVTGLIYFGPAATAPLNEAAIIALGNSQPTETYSFPMETGLNRIFCIALPPVKDLSTVVDDATEEDITSLFILTHIEVTGLVYNIYTMQNLLSFSSSHTFLISIVNV